MKLTRNLKQHLLPVCLVLAFALLLGLTLNLYKPLKQLTQKKVSNKENALNFSDIYFSIYKSACCFLPVQRSCKFCIG